LTEASKEGLGSKWVVVPMMTIMMMMMIVIIIKLIYFQHAPLH
jgi:hypothetical protein